MAAVDVGDDFDVDGAGVPEPSEGGGVVFGAVSCLVYVCGIFEYYDSCVKLEM